MNYRHAYHAGNFADVVKHVVLALVLDHLKRKAAPFRVIDTHAGAGRYALSSVEAGKTGEWRNGIGRLLGPAAQPVSPGAARILEPYLDVVRRENAGDALEVYPGSPNIALRLIRGSDVLIANELNEEERASLRAALGTDRRAKVMALDGWTAIKSLLPPRERRGVVLIDPPFEAAGEFERIAKGLAEGLERFATGIYIAWYPIKAPKPVARFHRSLAALGGGKLMFAELSIRRADDPDRLNGCGLILANPPYTLNEQLAAILPDLSRVLAAGPGAGFRLGALEEAGSASLGRRPARKSGADAPR
jgi:23S rRNA (adenine2030-N6)-methyltransferase